MRAYHSQAPESLLRALTARQGVSPQQLVVLAGVPLLGRLCFECTAYLKSASS